MPSTRMRYSVFTSTQVMKRIRNSGTSVKIYAATSTLSSAAERKMWAALTPNRSNVSPNSDASTINKALRILLPAITRDNRLLGARDCTNANSGTT